jgi:hypothetical protein
MSLAQLESEIDRLSVSERKRLTAYLVLRDRVADPEFKAEMARRIDDQTPANWLTLAEAETKLAH